MELGRRMKLALQEIDWGVRELDAARGESITPITVGAMPLGARRCWEGSWPITRRPNRAGRCWCAMKARWK
jgi:hypothetical protein